MPCALHKLDIFLLPLFVHSPTTAGQARKPVYDFWDDSPFDDIKWSSYNGITVSQVVVKNREPDQCIHSCIKDAGCVSFFYNRKTKTCEKVPFNFIWPDKVNDSRIEPDRYNRYYRYIPPKEPCMSLSLSISVCLSLSVRTRGLLFVSMHDYQCMFARHSFVSLVCVL